MQNKLINSHILKSYSFLQNRAAENLPISEVSKEIKSKNLAWIHLDANNQKTRDWLTKECKYLDLIIINGLLAEETRPRVEQVNDGIFFILRCVNLNDNSDPEDMVSIRMWIDPYRIITIQKRDTKSINDLEKSILSDCFIGSADDFLCLLLSKIFKRMEPILGSLNELMDNLEEEFIENPSSNLRIKLTNVRKQAIIFKRYMLPQRDALFELRNINLKWIKDLNKRLLKESHDHTIRYVEDLEVIRERSQIIKDELSNLLADKINRNMYILSVIAAIFLPLSFLTGLLGINVGGVPASNNPYGFYIVTGLLIILLILQIFFFKKKRWF